MLKKKLILFFELPILFLYAKNNILWSLPCLFSLACTIIVVLLFYSAAMCSFRLKEKAETLCWFFILVFWIIRPLGIIFKTFVLKTPILMILIQKFSVFFFLTCIVLMFFLLLKLNNKRCQKINKFFDVFTVLLAIILGLNILTSSISKFQNCNTENVKLAQNLSITSQKHPNIYHILLDAHSSNYVLKKYYNFDNDEFCQNLRNKGFAVIEPSFSNYPATQMSVASMLNYEYLPDNNLTVKILEQLRYNNKVFSAFYKNNFNIHVFDRTLQISYGTQFKKANSSNYALYWLWVQHSPLKWVFQKFFSKQMCLEHNKNIELDLKDLESAKKTFGAYNNLFYAHIVCPHAPFIYDENGNFDVSQGLIGIFTDNHGNFAKNAEELNSLKQKHLTTLQTIDKKILKVIQTILSQYEENEKPIIVLHSDHGTCLTTISPLLFDSHRLLPKQLNIEQEQLYGNLLSIYCPNSWHPEQVPLSLVNLYRFVFNNLFNEKHNYLENFCCVKD